jgi:hypothetical protein
MELLHRSAARNNLLPACFTVCTYPTAVSGIYLGMLDCDEARRAQPSLGQAAAQRSGKQGKQARAFGQCSRPPSLPLLSCNNALLHRMAVHPLTPAPITSQPQIILPMCAHLRHAIGAREMVGSAGGLREQPTGRRLISGRRAPGAYMLRRLDA